MAVLVTGGAGYIGSHTVIELLEHGEEVIVLDHLQTGHREAVDRRATFYEGDIRDFGLLNHIFHSHNIDSVLHFAGASLVGESMKEPLRYYDNNVGGTLSLIEGMIRFNVKHIIFSSTAAVYGYVERVPIEENAATNPMNVYGDTKLTVERLLQWSEEAYGIKFVSLRYFNVTGAHPDGIIGEDHMPETHLIPNVLKVALGEKEKVSIFGDDYDTPDGTCIRDYIHVMDLAKAHVLAMEYLRKGERSNIFNLGNGNGFSVKEIIEAASRISGRDIPYEARERRAGDPAILVSSAKKAEKELGWIPKYPLLDDIIYSAWKWMKDHPNGFRSEHRRKI